MLNLPSEKSLKNALKNFTFPIFYAIFRQKSYNTLKLLKTSKIILFGQFECLKYKILVLRSQWNIKNLDILSEKSKKTILKITSFRILLRDKPPEKLPNFKAFKNLQKDLFFAIWMVGVQHIGIKITMKY